MIPLENQFYIGFYNKSDFAKAGVTAVPTDWTQLYAACKKLKAAGYTPITYGNGGQPLGAEFYPWYDMSYMMIGQYSVSQWQKLYSGQIPWTSAANAAQLSNWSKLNSEGCTNSDVLTNTNNLGEFESGKAAMMVDGTWDTQKFTSALGSKVAAFVPPFSTTPIKGVVDFAGDGLSMTTYAQHPTQALQFLAFMTTPQAAQIINAAGLIPAIKGTSTSNPVNQEMLNFVSKDHMTAYPMLDNVVQPNVVNTGSKVLPSVLNGTHLRPARHCRACRPRWASCRPTSGAPVTRNGDRPAGEHPHRADQGRGRANARPRPRAQVRGRRLARRRRRAGILLSLPAVAVVVALLGIPIGAGRLLLDDQLERPHCRPGSARAPTPRR